jgi:hypothetical protein
VASPPAFRAKTGMSAMPTEANGSMLSWVHFGDLHITGEDEQNYRDFLALIEDVNTHLAGRIDFAVLPGDNADDGSEEQFRLVRRATDRLRIPLHILPGDHDRKPGNLDAFYKILDAEQLPKAVMLPGHRCLFLDIVSTGTGGPDFRLGAHQLGWLERQLFAAAQDEQRSIVFMHAYPADLREEEEVRTLFARYQVTAVDMGHTHYNEIANDGRTVYATTRSTGQVEEGPVGFSIAAVDCGVVSWRFKPLDAPWPLVLITSPADRAGHQSRSRRPRRARSFGISRTSLEQPRPMLPRRWPMDFNVEGAAQRCMARRMRRPARSIQPDRARRGCAGRHRNGYDRSSCGALHADAATRKWQRRRCNRRLDGEGHFRHAAWSQ